MITYWVHDTANRSLFGNLISVCYQETGVCPTTISQLSSTLKSLNCRSKPVSKDLDGVFDSISINQLDLVALKLKYNFDK